MFFSNMCLRLFSASSVLFILCIMIFLSSGVMHASTHGSVEHDFELFEDDFDLDAELILSDIYDVEIRDPYEIFNRFSYGLNKYLDVIILRPAALAYEKCLPSKVQTGVENFVRNLRTPLHALNHALQGNLRDASMSTVRFTVNTMLGLGGILDIASASNDLVHNPAFFGDTLKSYGVTHGNYLVIPFMGPGTELSVLGNIGDILFDPMLYATTGHFMLGADVVESISNREKYLALDAITDNAVDEYAKVRNIYWQSMLRHTKVEYE